MRTGRKNLPQPYSIALPNERVLFDLIYYCCPTNQEPFGSEGLMNRKHLRLTRDLPLLDQLSDDDFLTFDGPTGIVVAPDDTRHNFYHHLGLSEHVYRHKQIYRGMKAEAKAGMQRLFATRKSLRPDLVEDESIIAPYSVDQISEFAFQQQVEKIFKTASRHTRSWYTMMDTGDGKNWVIRWLLWRVLRKAEAYKVKIEEGTTVDETADDSSCALTTASSTVVDHPSVRTEPISPLFTSPRWMSDSSPKRLAFSDNEDDLDDRPRKTIKLETTDPAARASSSSSRQSSSFWNHVMNT